MTVGIAAITKDKRYIVVASDRMLSSGGIIQGADDATMKMSAMAKAWGATFAAQDANLFDPILSAVMDNLGNLKVHHRYERVSDAFTSAYRSTFDKTFTAQKLSRLGYSSIEDFRAKGREELGDAAFRDVLEQISKFDLSIVFLAYGFDDVGSPHIFEVCNPGVVHDRHLLNYAAIGSGIYMATAALRRRPPVGSLESTIYRVLEAKFSSETASGVGRSTSILILDKEGETAFPEDDLIEHVRKEWEKTLHAPDPPSAIAAIQQLGIPKWLEDKSKENSKQQK